MKGILHQWIDKCVSRGSLLILSACLLLVACSSSDHDETIEQPVLNIYIYAPNNMLPSRGNTDFVSSQTAENTIKTLQIWVFEHGTNILVGYFTPSATDELNKERQAVYQMAVTPQFVANKPNVDVYVLANVTAENCKCQYNENTTRTQLEEALMEHNGSDDPFGLTTPTTAVPADGLPMTGALRDQKVTGESPVLRVGDGTLATVKLVRAVSKLRFLFSQMKNGESKMKVKSVSLTGDILPAQQYLFLEEEYTGSQDRANTSGAYDAGPKQLVDNIDNVAEATDPLKYSYVVGMGPQEYENLIATGWSMAEPELTMRGPFYLRESDKKITGEIVYTVTDAEEHTVERTASFSIHDAGDFSRNHTWVVYAYYGSTTLDILIVRIKEWKVVQVLNHTVYNW